MTDVPELTPVQFRDRWPETTDADEVTLLDVREPAELELAAVRGAVHIPMREIPQRLHELDTDTDLVVLCHSGGRSRQVTRYLLASGFENVFNLSGGIDAWSLNVDPQVPRY